MDPLSEIVTMKALDGLMTRATVTAENIANANTPGYQARQVTFEQALAEAARVGAAKVNKVQAAIGADTSRAITGSNGPRVDLDLANAATTSSRYEALVEILNRQMQLDDLALTEIK